MPASQVFTGARALLKIGNDAIGYCLGVSGNTAINYQPLQAIGHLEVLEHVPVAYTVEMQANMSRLAGFTRLSPGTTFPRSTAAIEGTSDSPQVMPAFGTDGLAILQTGELTVTIYDRVTQKTIYTISGVKCAQKNWDIQGGGAVAENCTFVARIMNEDGENESALADTAAAAAAA